MSFVLRTARFAAARPVVATRPFSSTTFMALKESDRRKLLPTLLKPGLWFWSQNSEYLEKELD